MSEGNWHLQHLAGRENNLAGQPDRVGGNGALSDSAMSDSATFARMLFRYFGIVNAAALYPNNQSRKGNHYESQRPR